MVEADTFDATRRRLLLGAAGALAAGSGLGWAELAAAADHAHAATTAAVPPTEVGYLSPREAQTVTAIADCIVPGGKTPGATEAGAVYFIDHLMRHGPAERSDGFRKGLAEFTSGFERSNPGHEFASEGFESRTAYLRTVEATGFFATMRMLTIAGLLALPQYGGNRDKAGWRLVGFDDRHVWEPPFGDYDRDYAGFVPYVTAQRSGGGTEGGAGSSA